MWRDLGGYLFEELAGVTIPRVPQPPAKAPKLNLAPYTGKFERMSQQYELEVVKGDLIMTITGIGPRSAFALQSLADMRGQLDDLQRQLGTGQKSVTYAGIGLERGLAVGLRARLSALGYVDAGGSNGKTYRAVARAPGV